MIQLQTFGRSVFLNIICASFISIGTMAAPTTSKRQFYPAAERNKQPILDVLQKTLCKTNSKTFLEIASGSGQHISYFAPYFPNIQFLPSEESEYLFDSIDEHVKVNGLTNVNQARHIDAGNSPQSWYNGKLKKESLDYIYNSNMIHLATMNTTEGLFKGANHYLKHSGLLITYGPYGENGILTPQSNVIFNNSIQSVNPAHGIRDIDLDLIPLAKKHGFALLQKYDMPANNKVLVWHKL